MLLNILVSGRQWLQFIYLSLVGTAVGVKYSIFLSQGYKGLYPQTQARRKISLPHPLLGWEMALCASVSVDMWPCLLLHFFRAAPEKPWGRGSRSSALMQMLAEWLLLSLMEFFLFCHLCHSITFILYALLYMPGHGDEYSTKVQL